MDKKILRVLPSIKFIILKQIMWLVSIICTLDQRKKHLPRIDEVRTIAVFHFGGIGDMIVTTPAIRALANKYRKAKITFICSNLNHCMFFKEFPFILDLKAFNVYALDSEALFRFSFWRELRDIIKYLRSKQIDLLINFHHPFLIDWYLIEFLVVALSRSKYSIGANPYFLQRQSIYNRWLSESNLEGKHYKDFFLDIVELLGIVPENSDTEFPLSEEDRLFAESFIREKSLKSKILVSVHPGSSEPNKIWPIARYKQLCHDLINRGRKVILIGSSADQRLGEMISRDNPRVLNLIGKTSISQTAAIIERCSVFIGNDSGPFHISIAVRTPTIGLIGGGYPRFHLYSREDIQVIRKPVSCAPCRNCHCEDKHCMTRITVGEVLEAAETMLSKSKKD